MKTNHKIILLILTSILIVGTIIFFVVPAPSDMPEDQDTNKTTAI